MTQENDATNGEKKEKELNSILVEVWPDWTGPRVQREFRFGDGKNKFTTFLPVPTTEEDCEAIYGIGSSYALSKGWLQHSYDSDTNLGHIFVEKRKAGVDPATLPALVAETIEKDFVYHEKERKTSAEDKADKAKLNAAKKDMDLTLDQMIALARKQLEAEGKL